MGETELQPDANALQSERDELLPYFNQHNALTFIKERTEGYLAGLPIVAEDRREALRTYYADVVNYVYKSRQQMNLNSDPQIPEFPQLASYINSKGLERDIDYDGSPERVDIDDQDGRVQLIQHKGMLDGKESVRDRLRKHKKEKGVENNDKRNHKELEVS